MDFWSSAADRSLNRASVSLPKSARRAVAPSARHQSTHAERVAVLASYSPRLLIERIAASGEALRHDSQPEKISFLGAVVFVDVSGFTKLSEALSKEHGAVEGAELLNVYMNSFFQQVNFSCRPTGQT